MKGKPVPATGMLRLSSTSDWDTPLRHRAVMTPGGGQFHTNDEAKPHAIVEIAHESDLTGCLLRKTNFHPQRMRKAAVYTSQDGATWVKRAETEDMPMEWAVSFPEGTRAKWVKVEFDNTAAPKPAHLSHILIFQK